MNRPTDAGSFAEAVYNHLTPVQEFESAPEIDYALLKYLGAIGQMFQTLDELAHDSGGVPWSTLLDINRIPDEGLAWIGQFVGVKVNQSLSVSDQFQQVREHSGWNRGSLPAMTKAIRNFVGDNIDFFINERSEDAYTLEVIIDIETGEFTYSRLYGGSTYNYDLLYSDWYTYEMIYKSSSGTDVLDPIIDVINTQKPAGIILTVTAGTTSSAIISIYITNRHYRDLWLGYQTYEHMYLYYREY